MDPQTHDSPSPGTIVRSSTTIPANTIAEVVDRDGKPTGWLVAGDLGAAYTAKISDEGVLLVSTAAVDWFKEHAGMLVAIVPMVTKK